MAGMNLTLEINPCVDLATGVRKQSCNCLVQVDIGKTPGFANVYAAAAA